MNFGADIPFVTHLGFALELFEGGASAIGYTPLPEHLNSFCWPVPCWPRLAPPRSSPSM